MVVVAVGGGGGGIKIWYRGIGGVCCGDFSKWERGKEQIFGWWGGLLLVLISSPYCHTDFLEVCVFVR